MTRVVLVLGAAALLLPSTEPQVFSGLPFSGWPEYVAAMAFAVLLVRRGVRRLAARALAGTPALARGLAASLALAVGLKAVLFVSGDHRGLPGCYTSTLAPPPGGARCEASYENPLRRFDATRVDQRLDFGPDDWHLSFFNDIRFNFLREPGNRRRDRLPFAVTWTGWLEAPADGRVIVAYAGEGRVQAGERVVRLEPAYGHVARATLEVAAGRVPLLVSYRYDDGSRHGTTPPGPYATLRVRVEDAGGRPAAATFGSRRHGLPGRAAAWTADASISLAVVALLVLLGRLAAPHAAPMTVVAALAAAGPWLASRAYPPMGRALAPALAVLAWVLLRRGGRAVLAAWLALVAVAPWALWPIYRGLPTVVLRSAGDDWLTYESFARAILEERSLEGGEPVFYYQPGFRYVRFLEHLVFGDGDLLVAATAFALLLFAVVWTMRRLHRPRPASWIACGIAGTLMLVVCTAQTGAVSFIVDGASEYPTWIATLLALPAMWVTTTRRRWIAGAGALGVAAVTRLNQLPGLLVLLGSGLARLRRHGATGQAVAVVTALLLLPLAHNAWYGASGALLPTSQNVSQNVVLPPERVIAALHDADARAELRSQLVYVLAFTPLRWDLAALWFSLHALQALWIAVVAWAAATGRLRPWAALAALAPAAYLAVHVVYQVAPYHPRHVLAGHLLMGAVAALCARLPAARSVGHN